MTCYHSKKGSLSIRLSMSDKEQSEDGDGDTQADDKAPIDAYKGKGEERKASWMWLTPFKRLPRWSHIFRGKDHEGIIRRRSSQESCVKGAYPPRKIGIALGSQNNGVNRTARLGVPF